MARFHALKVCDVRRETADCVSIAFEVPPELKTEYAYIQGQYLTLKLAVNGEEIRRSYSLCSSPATDAEIRIAAKKVVDGRGSTFLNERVQVGDILEVMTPMGNFHTPLDTDHEKEYVLFAGGSGITPMLSILKTVLNKEPKSSVVLFYANRDKASVIFHDTLNQLSAQYAGRLKVYHILDEPPAGTEALFHGIMTAEKATELLMKFVPAGMDREYFICGPALMMDNVKYALEGMGADPKKIHIEYFSAVQADIMEAEKEHEEKGPVLPDFEAQVTVIMDDEPFAFALHSHGQVILDAASDAGVDAPFSCKGAVCCTCKAKVLEGKVVMDKNFALSDEEVAQGYILTCQSHPASEKVVVSYDDV